MSTLAFRNLDAAPSDPVESWPYEGIVAAIERGSLSDWQRLAAAIRASPWGSVARAIEAYAGYGDERAVADLLIRAISDAREAARRGEEQECARRVQQAIARSGHSARLFARECGTSAARMSTYVTGKVQPSAAMLIRIERLATALAER